MKKAWRLTIVASLIMVMVVISGCVAITPMIPVNSDPSSESRSMLSLAITSDREVYQSNEDIILTLTLKNTGSSPIRINNRMATHLAQAPKSLWDVAFRIIDESGSDLTQLMAIDKRLPGPKTYIDLMPSGKFEQKFNLSALYGFPPSLQVKNHSVGTGKYRIQAIYQNQVDPSDAVDVWEGEIKSDSILITIQ